MISARYITSKYSSSSATQILPKDIADKSSLKTGGNTNVQKTKSNYFKFKNINLTENNDKF